MKLPCVKPCTAERPLTAWIWKNGDRASRDRCSRRHRCRMGRVSLSVCVLPARCGCRVRLSSRPAFALYAPGKGARIHFTFPGNFLPSPCVLLRLSLPRFYWWLGSLFFYGDGTFRPMRVAEKHPVSPPRNSRCLSHFQALFVLQRKIKYIRLIDRGGDRCREIGSWIHPERGGAARRKRYTACQASG